MFNWVSFIPELFKPITEGLRGWNQRKAVKLESDIRIAQAVTEAKISLLANGQKADIAWENLSIQNSGWKDEFWTIVLSIPMIMCFIPGLVDYVSLGFEALTKTPEWYQWAVSIAIGSAFGVRQFTKLMQIRKGD